VPDGNERLQHTNGADAAYQGQPGAYSEGAARRICGATATLLPCDTLADVFAAVAAGRARAAVIPIENTLAGAVPGALRLLFDSGWWVDAEATEWIDHVLAGPAGSSVEALREVLSHPVALAQCTRFFQEHRSVRATSVFDTAGAMAMVMRDGDPTRAAIAGRDAAALHGATILAEHLQDHDANYTRFLRVVPADRAKSPARSNAPTRAMLSLRLPHRPGALAAALSKLAERGLNLTRIDSSPIAGSPFEYEFLIEAVTDGDVPRAVSELGSAMHVRVIGVLAPSGLERNALTSEQGATAGD
jgi:prephenate dehydratase